MKGYWYERRENGYKIICFKLNTDLKKLNYNGSSFCVYLNKLSFI